MNSDLYLLVNLYLAFYFVRKFAIFFSYVLGLKEIFPGTPLINFIFKHFCNMKLKYSITTVQYDVRRYCNLHIFVTTKVICLP